MAKWEAGSSVALLLVRRLEPSTASTVKGKRVINWRKFFTGFTGQEQSNRINECNGKQKKKTA